MEAGCLRPPIAAPQSASSACVSAHEMGEASLERFGAAVLVPSLQLVGWSASQLLAAGSSVSSRWRSEATFFQPPGSGGLGRRAACLGGRS